MKGTLFAIQHYAVHDGPGIRTLVFLKGCPLRCAWCCNPESHDPRPQLRYIPFRCKGCLNCVSACTLQTLEVEDGKIRRDFGICQVCVSKDCVEACPYEAVSLSGKEISEEKLMDKIARDAPFYRNSGGGVTFSGGEPFNQPEFLIRMLQKCRELNIHTAVETCGWTTHKILREAIPLTGLFLFDLKIIDPENHLRYTGQPVGPILENLAILAASHPEVIIRFPLIPGVTDTPENLKDIARVMKQNRLRRISLEPYHTLGSDKYEEHGMEYPLAGTGLYPPGGVESVQNFFESLGFSCDIV